MSFCFMNSTVSTKKLVINFIATTLKTVYLKVMFILSLADFNHFLYIDFQLFIWFSKEPNLERKKKKNQTQKRKEREREWNGGYLGLRAED